MNGLPKGKPISAQGQWKQRSTQRPSSIQEDKDNSSRKSVETTRLPHSDTAALTNDHGGHGVTPGGGPPRGPALSRGISNPFPASRKGTTRLIPTIHRFCSEIFACYKNTRLPVPKVRPMVKRRSSQAVVCPKDQSTLWESATHFPQGEKEPHV